MQAFTDKLNRSRGFTLVEILIAVFLLVVAAIAITGLAVLGTRLSLESERQNVAQAIVNEKMEFVRTLDYTEVGYSDATGQEADGILERSEVVMRNDQSYATTSMVLLVDEPNNGVVPDGQLEELNADYKQVRIETEWTSAGGNERMVAVTTYVSPAGNLTSCTPGEPTCPGSSICPLNGLCYDPLPAAYCPTEAYFCEGAGSGGTFGPMPIMNIRAGQEKYVETATQVEAVFTGFANAAPWVGFCLSNESDPPGSFIQFKPFEVPFLQHGQLVFDTSGPNALSPGFYEFRLGGQLGVDFACYNPAITYRFEVVPSIVVPPPAGSYEATLSDLAGNLQTSFTSTENVVAHWRTPSAGVSIDLLGIYNTLSGVYVDGDFALFPDGSVSFGFLPPGSYELHVYSDADAGPDVTTSFSVVN